jgi:hypothetical protein
MRKRRKSGGHQEKRPKTPKPIFASPFKALKKMLREREALAEARNSKAASPPPKAIEPVAATSDDAALLQQALEGVRPLAGSGPTRIPLDPRVSREIVSEEAEVLAQLSDIVSGQAAFDITESDEYVEGARTGLDPRVLTRLRRGEFAVQAHIDLHGMIQSAAIAIITARM